MPQVLEPGLAQHLSQLGTRLKALRSERCWTLEELARQAKLSTAYLCRLETGERQPSLAALISLAQAFEQPLAALFEAQTRSSITVTRAGSTARQTGNELEVVPLTGGKVSHLNAVLLTVPAERKSNETHHHDSEELIFVLEGRVCLQVGAETITLEQGDSAHYDARAEHRCNALDGQPAKVLLVASTAPKSQLDLNPT